MSLRVQTKNSKKHTRACLSLKARRNLFANISHDLKTPMTLIQGYTEAILDDMITEDEQKRKYLKLIHSKIVNLSNLTNDVFELSQRNPDITGTGASNMKKKKN